MFYLGVATVLATVVHLLRRRSLDLASVALERALRAATEDSMTGLANRRGLAMLGSELVAVGRRHSDAVHCAFLDVDGLKGVNDHYGHEEGDRVIREVARALRTVARETDVVARWGGDEFVVVGLGPGVPPLDLENRVADRIARENPADAALSHVRISVGRAMLEPWDNGDLERLLWLADKDMYVRRERQRRSVPPVVTLDRTQPPQHDD
jgi:diguanylate cyclase (GGDEF)-like protein